MLRSEVSLLQIVVVPLLIINFGCGDHSGNPESSADAAAGFSFAEATGGEAGVDGETGEAGPDGEAADGSSSSAATDVGPTDASTCKNYAAMDSFETCKKADTQTSCQAAGGEWKAVGLSDTPGCVCPTGEEGCPCTGSDDCTNGSCIGERGTADGGAGICLTHGSCQPISPYMGCHCHVYDGESITMCLD